MAESEEKVKAEKLAAAKKRASPHDQPRKGMLRMLTFPF